MSNIPGIVVANADQIGAFNMDTAPAIVRSFVDETPHGPAVAVVDYHKGNLMSVARGLAAAGAQASVTDDPAEIARASAVVVPGVGAFDDAMAYMRESGQADALLAAISEGAPLLGICLGMQLLFERGDEHAQPPAPGEPAAWTSGLGLLAGEVTRLPAVGVKIPHVGWNAVCHAPAAASCPLFEGVPDETYFYFTHSYACAPADDAVLMATTEHGTRFASAVWDGGRLFGTQFHPEKSSEAGQAVLRNFVRVAAEAQGLDLAELAAHETAVEAVDADVRARGDEPAGRGLRPDEAQGEGVR